ncbi:MAG: DsrH/TusB family sulfur metabolism protein [candidate division NC10 bacterium]|jgi:sulfur relay protein TusB/DsrH
MRSILILIGSGPRTPQAEQALTLAVRLRQAGHQLRIALIQDASLMALARPGCSVPPAVSLYVVDEDLRLRGCRKEDVVPGVRIVDRSELVDLMMEQSDAVMGAF